MGRAAVASILSTRQALATHALNSHYHVLRTGSKWLTRFSHGQKKRPTRWMVFLTFEVTSIRIEVLAFGCFYSHPLAEALCLPQCTDGVGSCTESATDRCVVATPLKCEKTRGQVPHYRVHRDP